MARRPSPWQGMTPTDDFAPVINWEASMRKLAALPPPQQVSNVYDYIFLKVSNSLYCSRRPMHNSQTLFPLDPRVVL